MTRFFISRPKPLAAGQRWPAVTALKGLALVLVLVYHGGGVLDLPNRLHGEVGVDIFLLVSGFLLSLTACELPARDFLRKRFFRLFPTYWLALAFFVVLDAALLHRFFTFSDVAVHVLGLQATVHGAYASDINDSFWFITTIVFLYLVFFGLRRRTADLPLVLGVGGLTTLVCLLPYPGFDHLSGRLPGFFLGICLGQVSRGGEIRLRPGFVFAAGAAAFAVLEWRGSTHANYPGEAMAIAAVFLLLDRLLRPWAAGRLLLAPLEFLGLYSYEIYLFHQPLIRDYNLWFQHAVLLREPTRGEILWGMVVALALAVAIARAAAILARHRRWQACSLAAAGAALLALAAGAGPGLARGGDTLRQRVAVFRAAAPTNPALEGYPGPLRLVVRLPGVSGPPSSPLVVTGRTGSADLLGLVRVDGGHVRFTLDHWGQYVLASADLPLADSAEHVIDVLMGSLLPAAGSAWLRDHRDYAPLGGRLYVAIDGREAFNRDLAFHPAGPAEAFVGLNPAGGSTTGAYFTGRILAVQSVGLRGFLEDHPAAMRPAVAARRAEDAR